MFGLRKKVTQPVCATSYEMTCKEIACEIVRRAKQEAYNQLPGSKLIIMRSYEPYEHIHIATKLKLLTFGDKDVRYDSTQADYHTFTIQ